MPLTPSDDCNFLQMIGAYLSRSVRTVTAEYSEGLFFGIIMIIFRSVALLRMGKTGRSLFRSFAGIFEMLCSDWLMCSNDWQLVLRVEEWEMWENVIKRCEFA